ncbi:heparinase II/III family protein [Dyadobacter psychrotolerans]|uniref:Alginate lyase family protein n=1 Tax=Dyadobacter psychrotolerans TaxID=2541721 RepID=A0A4R5DF06_9BACT|nr:alginate lyase family protein [Dyadobacter psychrotolerans]TDE12502.1 alginate lyase family protein [Dyadobacter psychrotolerans]
MKNFIHYWRTAKYVLHEIRPFELIRNMGFRYVTFRLWFAFQKHTGLLKLRFPKHSDQQKFIILKSWQYLPVKFFFHKPFESAPFSHSFDELKKRVEALHNSNFQFFNSVWRPFKGWHIHPETGFEYGQTQHWSEISDFSTQAGDIKYIWEMSRFTFVYDLIRYDFHFQEDQSSSVLYKIENWIDSNPVNCGPNWKCSQEITFRVLNWTFALQYYKRSDRLTEELFEKIINSIHRQIQHVEQNINFSRIAVRNNHALTETLGLYLTGLLYPFFPESARWKEKGKSWFEEEIEYQIEEDGTFLQFSMNYHRVVIQLLTWSIGIAEANGEKWNEIIYDRARKSLHFLRTCQDDKTGWLPNYGNNDGALFFPSTEAHFRDYRPQLAALANVLACVWAREVRAREFRKPMPLSPCPTHFSFPQGGYYVLRDSGTITFLRCGSYKNRPFQADNLHIDIWVDGENIMRDAGSYRYNADKKWTGYFSGTASHNTVMLGDYDQMTKGPGFVWYDWIKKSKGEWRTEEGKIIFDGFFEGFRHLGKDIKHRRKMFKRAGELYWQVEDWIENAPDNLPVRQVWHPSETFFEKFTIQAFDKTGNEILPDVEQSWYSQFYGIKKECKQIVFSTPESYIKTVIRMH